MISACCLRFPPLRLQIVYRSIVCDELCQCLCTVYIPQSRRGVYGAGNDGLWTRRVPRERCDRRETTLRRFTLSMSFRPVSSSSEAHICQNASSVQLVRDVSVIPPNVSPTTTVVPACRNVPYSQDVSCRGQQLSLGISIVICVAEDRLRRFPSDFGRWKA